MNVDREIYVKSTKIILKDKGNIDHLKVLTFKTKLPTKMKNKWYNVFNFSKFRQKKLILTLADTIENDSYCFTNWNEIELKSDANVIYRYVIKNILIKQYVIEIDYTKEEMVYPYPEETKESLIN